MNFPHFPTDNLYKFLALAGLVLLGICLFYPFISLEDEIKYSSRAMAINKELSIDIKNLKESHQKLADRLTMVAQGWQKLKDEISASPNATLEWHKKASALESEQKQIEDQAEANKKSDTELEKREAESDANDQIAKAVFDQAEFYRQLCLMGDAVGFTACFAGFWLWYLKLQRHQDEIIALEVKAALKQKPAAARRVSKRPGRLLAATISQ